MQPIRPVDRSLAAQSGSRPASPDRSRRKNVSDLRAFYWAGPGWEAALKEARGLIQGGASVKAAATHVGWAEKDLVEALSGDGQPILDQIAKPVVKKRPPRPLAKRVKGLGRINKKEQALAKRLYALEYMTVREVAEALERPYESTYLVLIRAGVKFRRPGRRSSRR